MTTGKRNDEMVNLLRPDFFARAEPNASWVHYQSAILSTCGLAGFWPMSAVVTTGTEYARDVGCGYDLTAMNYPTFGYYANANVPALHPWINFDSATSQYLTYGLDDAQHDILGTETYISANEQGLTMGGWFKFTTVPAANMVLMSKWLVAGNQLAYVMYKDAGNNIKVQVTTDGSTIVNVTSAGVVAADIWYHLYGRFNPSTSLDVFIDNVKTSNVAGIPASIFNSTEPFMIACGNRAGFLNGKASMCQLNRAQLTDSIIRGLWETSRTMYGK